MEERLNVAKQLFKLEVKFNHETKYKREAD
jgi:hypothetical protein